MIDLLNGNDVPASNRSCKNCAYSVRRAKFDVDLFNDTLFAD